MVAPDTDGWKDAMNREMQNLTSHVVYELVPCMSSVGMLTVG